jgi:hypothetical protein
MNYAVALLIFGILLLLIGLVGKVKAKELEVGTSSRIIRSVVGTVGVVLIALSLIETGMLDKFSHLLSDHTSDSAELENADGQREQEAATELERIAEEQREQETAAELERLAEELRGKEAELERIAEEQRRIAAVEEAKRQRRIAAAEEAERQRRIAAAEEAERQSMEQNTDRPGLDIRGFDLPVNDPAACQRECQNNGQCKAWTFVKPNTIQGPRPRCWLKHTIPSAKRNACCVSGTKTR